MRKQRVFFVFLKNIFQFSILNSQLFRTFVNAMKVLIVNTSEQTGGAAVAANRLMAALNNHGVKTKMLVGRKDTDNICVVETKGKFSKRWHFLWERLVIFFHLHFKREHLFEIDIANSGTDITMLREFKEADVIHLHWINQGMLSLKGIRKILRSGKPVVWTMHDMWPATAICHYARNCKYYCSKCDKCPLLPGSSAHNLAAKVWQRKKNLLEHADNLSFVTCSRWLEGEAKKSALLCTQSISSIPNAIDTRIYSPQNKTEARQKAGLPTEGRIILFVSQRVTDERKGIGYFIEAIAKIVTLYPALKDNTTVAILGGHADEVAGRLAMPAHALGYVSNEQAIVNIYNAADVFVTPSLEDNLPNTIMEALACGVPCVGFRVGGIPEMIDHQKNGYVAALRDSNDLANGIGWILCEADGEALHHHAVRKVMQNYSQASVALHYTEIYQQAIAKKHFCL